MLEKTQNQRQREDIFELLLRIDSKVESICRPVAQPAWFNSKEAAKFLGITTRTLQNWRDMKYIPFSQFGREIRYKSTDLEKFLQEHYVKSSSWKGGSHE